MTTTIEQFLNMNPDYQRLFLTKVFKIIEFIKDQLEGAKTAGGHIVEDKDRVKEIEGLLACGEPYEMYRFEKAELNLKIEENIKKRNDHVDDATKLAQGLIVLISDPKKYAIQERNKELNE